MIIETTKKKIAINRLVNQRKENIIAESDIIVNDSKPDVLEIVNTSGIPCIYKKEVLEGKVRLDGSANVYINYIADDENGSVRTLNTVIDFSENIMLESCKIGMLVEENIKVGKIEYRILNGRKVNIRIHLEVSIKVYSKDEFQIVSNIETKEDLETFKGTKKIMNLVGEGKSKVFAKDTISIDQADEVGEIMQLSIKMANEETKTSYNKVLSKTNMDVEILYLTEDNRINTVNASIPVMGFVDIQNVSDENKCISKYKIKNIIVKQNNSETHGIYVEVELELNCSVYECKEIEVLKDLYAIHYECNFVKNTANVIVEKDTFRSIHKIRENINVPETTNKKIYNIMVNPKINSIRVLNGKALYDGEAEVKIIYDNNNVSFKTVIIPITHEENLPRNIDKDDVEVSVATKNKNVIINSDGSLSLDIDLEFITEIEKNEDMEIIDNITLKEMSVQNKYSMVIYFVKPGDSLWKISKKFHSKIEEIRKVNNIEDIEKIYPGQQLYIPKFCRKSVSV